MASKIKLVNASFSYGDTNIFSGLNLEVPQGQVFSILGANGCGKTTLLRCLYGALKLESGSVYLEDKDMAMMSTIEIAKRMGFVFQEHNPSFPYSVLEIVVMGRTPHLKLFESPSKRDTEIALQSLQRVGIEKLANQRYTEISGGERQLTLIARTLAQEPDVILLDEPTASLDFKNQALILNMVNRLADQGLTIIMTTHFPNHALLYSSRVALMKRGGFIGVGETSDVINEESLSATYNIPVKIFSVYDCEQGRKVKFCIPVEEQTGVVSSGLPGVENTFWGQAKAHKKGIKIEL